MVKPPDKLLTGNRCLCRECGEYFNSAWGFTEHRVGGWGNHGHDRRCLTVDEMLKRGWSLNEAGFWITSKSPYRGGSARAGAEI